MKTFRTGADGWKIDCKNWAKMGLPFEIHGVTTSKHLAFCAELCVDHDLRAARKKSIVTFFPLKSRPPAE